jgi:uncharacterized membrane protein
LQRYPLVVAALLAAPLMCLWGVAHQGCQLLLAGLLLLLLLQQQQQAWVP